MRFTAVVALMVVCLLPVTVFVSGNFSYFACG